jgi:hypothetical protein
MDREQPSSGERRADALRILPADWPSAGRAMAGAIAGVALLIVVLDCWIFRATLSAGTVGFFTSQPLFHRALSDAAGSVLEEVIVRLVIMTLLVGLGSLIWRRPDGRPRTAVFIAAIMLADLIDCARTPGPYSPVSLFYDALRYYTPGLVWGWLYWRHGWVSAAAAHFGVHLVFEPAVFFLLR